MWKTQITLWKVGQALKLIGKQISQDPSDDKEATDNKDSGDKASTKPFKFKSGIKKFISRDVIIVVCVKQR